MFLEDEAEDARLARARGRDAARRRRGPRRPPPRRRARPPPRRAASSRSPSSSASRTRCSTACRPSCRRAESARSDDRSTSTAPRVVIAEDEAIIRLDLTELLEEEGYDVVGETGRGDEAVELVRELRPDLVILDIKMPGLDGLSAARQIAGERLAAVLILTAFSQRDLVEQARDAGALAYLVKPFQKSDLHPRDRGRARPPRRAGLARATRRRPRGAARGPQDRSTGRRAGSWTSTASTSRPRGASSRPGDERAE